VARQAVWLSGLMDFAQAAEALQELGQIAISASSVWRLSEEWGEKIRQQEEIRREKGQAMAAVAKRALGQPERLGIAMDGAMLYIRGEEWKEFKIGCTFEVGKHAIFDQQSQEWLEVGRAVENRYVAHLGGPEMLGEKLWAEAQQRGWGQARETQVIGDGAAWIWNLAAEHFYTSHQLVDWYHSTEHLAKAATLLYGEGSAGARHWLKQQETVLFQGDAARIAQTLREAAERQTSQGEELLKEATYFEHNKRRMDYLEMRADGWVIGSGMVESGAKQFKARFTAPGMRWTRPGAERLLPVRAEIMSKRFNQCWQSAYHSPLN
jgi:hypothetical protein